MDAERWYLLTLGLGATPVALWMVVRAVHEPWRRSSRRRRISRLCFGLGYALLAIGQLAAASSVAYGAWIDFAAEGAFVAGGVLWLARRGGDTGHAMFRKG